MKNLIFKGDLLTADFEEKTMTFEIENDMVVQAGNYTIVRTEDYEKLVNGVDLKNDKALHKHCVNGSALDSDPQIDYHMNRVKAVNHYLEDKGNLAARVFLRATGAINNHDGTYTIQEQDIKAWFEAGSHLTAFTEYDTM